MSTAKPKSQLRPRLVVDRTAARSLVGPVTVVRPYSALPVSEPTGVPANADPPVALLHGHAGLEMVAALSKGLPDDYAAADQFDDGEVRCVALSKRVFGKARKMTRAPRTAVFSGSGGIGLALAIADRSDQLEEVGVDAFFVLRPGSNQQLTNPLAFPLPIASAVAGSAGHVRAEAPGGPELLWTNVTARPSTGYVGGATYWASLSAERMGFGLFTTVTAIAQTPPFTAGPGSASLGGYTFKVRTFWDSVDPGSQSFAGCEQVGLREFEDVVTPGDHLRVQTFLNLAHAAADRAALSAYLPAFDRFRLAFWADETLASSPSPGGDPADTNPGSPAVTAATIDGGLNVVTYHPLPQDDDARADALVADAVAFFAG